MTRGVIALSLTALLMTGCSGSAATPTPRASETSSPPAGPLAGTTVVVDPGHNGGNADHPDEINSEVDIITDTKPCNTVGAQTVGGYAEHEFNFEVAGLLTQQLEASGAQVVSTRDDNDGVGPCVDERAAIGNDAGADAVISIHADGGPESGRGFHIMEPMEVGPNDAIVEPSHQLATDLADALASDTELSYSDYIGSEGLNPRDDMGGLNLSTVPVVMTECGNMANAEDARLQEDPKFREELAAALAAGVTEFLT